MNKWNGKRFSIYDNEEKQMLGLVKKLGDQTNYNTDEVERLTISNNKKVSHEEMKSKYKIDEYADFTGSWFGIKRPTQSNEGIASTVEQIIDETIPNINTQLEHNTKKIEEHDREIYKSVNYKTTSLSISKYTTIDNIELFLNIAKRQGIGITLCILTNIETPTSSTFERVPESLIHLVFQKAIEKDVKIIMIKPHIVYNWGDDFYRPNYNPSDIDNFFTNWGNELLWYINICKKYNVQLLSLTCEQQNQTMAEHYSKWLNIINVLRKQSPKTLLTCSMTTGELYAIWKYYKPQNRENIVNLLDVFGINSYLTWTNKIYNPTADNIKQNEIDIAWWNSVDFDNHLEKLCEVCTYYKIPFFITECGCMNKVDGLKSVVASGDENYHVQALLFNSIFNVAANNDLCIGFALWNLQDPFRYWLENETTEAEKVVSDYCGGVL